MESDSNMTMDDHDQLSLDFEFPIGNFVFGLLHIHFRLKNKEVVSAWEY